MRQTERRKDTREKIELGGLVVKAGLREADKAFILGALMSAAALSEDDPRWRELRQIGGAAFAATTVSEKPSQHDGGISSEADHHHGKVHT